MTPTCQCGTPVDGATLCGSCVVLLEHTVANIGTYAADLPTVLAKLTRYGDRYGGRTRERSLPVDMRASEAEWVARNTVSTWCRVLLEEQNLPKGPNDDVPSMCRWLLLHVNRVRVAEWGGEAFDELQACEQLLRRVVDRPAERWYAGKCSPPDCTEDLYALSNVGTVVCQVCHTEHDVPARRQQLLLEVEDQLETATAIARAVVVLGDSSDGESRIADRIRLWTGSNRLVAHGHLLVHGRQRPTYRVGDVLDLMQADARRAAERRAG